MAIITWDGHIDADFLTPLNWDLVATPGTGDDAVININSTVRLFGGDSATVSTLAMSAGSFQIEGNFSATSGITFSGTSIVEVLRSRLITSR